MRGECVGENLEAATDTYLAELIEEVGEPSTADVEYATRFGSDLVECLTGQLNETLRPTGYSNRATSSPRARRLWLGAARGFGTPPGGAPRSMSS